MSNAESNSKRHRYAAIVGAVTAVLALSACGGTTDFLDCGCEPPPEATGVAVEPTTA